METKIKVARRNANGVLVEQRVMDGRTKFFKYTEEEEAKQYAFDKRSYVDNCYREQKLVGFTVPN